MGWTDATKKFIKGSIPTSGMFSVATEQQFEVSDKTKFFLDGKECKKTDIKPGQRLVIDGRPALTVKAFTTA